MLMADLWGLRPKWFKKPFAMQLSPYRNTIWIDLDCEIKGDVGVLFSTCQNKAGLAIAPEPDYSNDFYMQIGLLHAGEKNYNSGVVVFKHDSYALVKWIESIIENNVSFIGDQDVLAYIIREEHLDIYELAQIYNWRMAQGPNPQAVIVHWVADSGKEHIRQEMARERDLHAH